MTTKRVQRSKAQGNGAGSVYFEKSSGRWVAAVTYRDGRRNRRKKVRCKTQREAQSVLVKLLADLERGLVPLDERQTVGAFLASWIDSRRDKIRDTTWDSYEEVVRIFLTPDLGHIKLARLTPQQVEAFMRRMLNEGRSPGRARYARIVLRNALSHALRLGLVTRNAAAQAEPPRVERKPAGFLSAEEAWALIDATREDRLFALWVIAIGLGLRRGELLGLRWSAVDFEAGVLHVREQVQRVKVRAPEKGKPKSRLATSVPKSAQSRRALVMPAVIVAALRAHKAKQAAERLAAGPAWQEGDHVFTTETGGLLDPRNVLRRFQERLQAAGLPKRKLHATRHTAASLLLAGGVAGRVVQDILGHSDIRLTLGTYSHVVPSLHREAADKMDALFGG
jgi:integrase